MIIRNAVETDISEINEIYTIARQFMRDNGNKKQWINGYPSEELLKNDIKENNLYVCVENNSLCGVFAFILGDDPTYKVIENGHWHSNNTYGTIHRIASNGKVKGLAKQAFDFCLTKSSYLRIDTHEDNVPMQNTVTKYGFKKCGTIYVADGSPRVAFDYIK